MKKSIYAFLSVMIVFSFLTVLSSCNPQKQEKQIKPIEIGLHFSGEGGDPPLPSDFAAYRSDKNIFSIDDVTLEFFYGWYSYSVFSDGRSGLKKANDREIPECEIFFLNEKSNIKCSIKKFNDYLSDEYQCIWVLNEKMCMTEMRFNHLETITIPQELFVGDSGCIYFCVAGEDTINLEGKTGDILTSQYMYYRKNGDKITLSAQEFILEQY